MSQKPPFSRIVIEPATNGYVVEVEYEDHELKYVYQSLRVTLRELKKLLNVDHPD